jgi:DNA-damage-inducible protein J
MAKSEMIRARVEPELKRRAETILSRLGVTPTAAITMLYTQVVLRRGLPFEIVLESNEHQND